MKKPVIVLSSFFLIFQALPLNAATVGTGKCQQNVTITSGTGSVVVTEDSGDCILEFKNIGNTTWTVPSNISTVWVLAIGGGGGGGGDEGGGGGGGGYVENTNFAVTSGSSVSITVGDGGIAGTDDSARGGNGQTSTVLTGGIRIDAIGGGGGGTAANGTDDVSVARRNGSDGGSGGGGAGESKATAGGTGTQGFSGGSGLQSRGLGGGGAGGSAPNSSTTTNGSPGVGKASEITGISVIRAAGGSGGGGNSQNKGAPGVNGGGNGGGTNGSGTGGTDYTGGGGGGGGSSSTSSLGGYSGGAGIVIVRYAPAPVNSILPTISGTQTFGLILNSTNGSWTNSVTSYSYQWSRAATSGGTYSNISGATNFTYTLVTADVAQYLKVTVTAINADGSTAATSIATSQIAKATPIFSAWSDVSKIFGDGNYTVIAPSTAGFPEGELSYGSSNTSVISILGATLTVEGGGTATITATFTPTDTSSYNPATTTNSVMVDKASQSAITITSTAAIFGSDLTLTSTGGSTGGPFTYTKVSGDCTVSGQTLTPTASGSCTIQSSLVSTANYLAAQSANTTITIATSNVSASITLDAANLIYRQVKVITATATVAGKVTFKVNGKKLPGCIKKSVSAPNSYTATCSYKPSTRGYIRISTTLNPTNDSYIGTTTTSERLFVGNRSGKR